MIKKLTVSGELRQSVLQALIEVHRAFPDQNAAALLSKCLRRQIVINEVLETAQYIVYQEEHENVKA
jgi:hypothetical protein